MSQIILSPNASGTGQFTIASPNSNTNRTIDLPDAAGAVVLDTATQTLTNKTLTSPTMTTPTINSAQVETVSGTAPLYMCRAWVNFDGTSNSANVSGTYSQTGTTVTVTITNHGYITGNSAYLDFTTGTAVDGEYTVTVIDANTFTVTQASRTTSGNVTDRRNPIRASGNVSSVADTAAGEYEVNFATAMPDTNYAVAGQASRSANYVAGMFGATNRNLSVVSIKHIDPAGSTSDANRVDVVIFR